MLVKNYFKESLLPIFCLIIQVKGFFFSKGFDAEHWWEIYLVAFLTRSVLAACLHARNEMGSFVFPLIANMLFVSIKLFLAGKGLCDFSALLNSVAYYPRLTNLHVWNICLHVLKSRFTRVLFTFFFNLWANYQNTNGLRTRIK